MTVKLFLGGVSPNTPSEVISSHFAKFGHVTDAVVMRDRGFGFVTFESQEGADNALAQPQQVIEGQTIDVKHAVGKGGGKGGGGGGGGGRGGPAGGGVTDKIFIGGLPQDCSDDKIRNYFERYGNIVDTVVMKDKDTGRSRGFGFIQFDNPAPVEQVMADYSSHKIEGKWVEVKRSIPKDQMPSPPPRSGGGGGGGGGGRGGCGGGGYCGGGGSHGAPPHGYGMPPAGYGGACMGGPYGGGAYGGAYGAYGGAYGGYPGYPGYGGGYGMPPPSGYGGYGMNPYAGGYGYSAPPGPAGHGPQPAFDNGGKGSRSAPY